MFSSYPALSRGEREIAQRSGEGSLVMVAQPLGVKSAQPRLIRGGASIAVFAMRDASRQTHGAVASHCGFPLQWLCLPLDMRP